MKITYLFFLTSVICTIGVITSILSQDYRILPMMLFFSVVGIIAFIMIRKEENTPCICKSFWNNGDDQCFRCGGKEIKDVRV